VYFDSGPKRSLFAELPAALSAYRAILLDAPAYDAALAGSATRQRLAEFVRNGGYIARMEDPIEGDLRGRTNPNSSSTS